MLENDTKKCVVPFESGSQRPLECNSRVSTACVTMVSDMHHQSLIAAILSRLWFERACPANVVDFHD